MEIVFLGHACCLVETGAHRIIFDPYLTDNPSAPLGVDDLDVDAILLTHGHSDHFGDALELAKRCDATIIAPFELAGYCEQKGAKVHAMHIGGAHTFAFGKVKLTPAWHGSAVFEGDQIIYTGNPCGYLLWADGTCLYNSGDTALFGDMRLLGERNAIDVALLPIGDNFTMGPDDALCAAEMLGAKTVIPLHYNTWELIQQDGEAFVKQVRAAGFQSLELAPGERFSLSSE